MSDICDLELPKKNKMNLCQLCELLVILFLSFLAFIYYLIVLENGELFYLILTFGSLLAYFIGFVLAICGFSCKNKNKVIWGYKSFFFGCVLLFFFFILYLKDVNENDKGFIILFLLNIGTTLCFLLIQLRNSGRFRNDLNR